jgi:exodeoxyribonuclease VII small subunit
MAELKFDQALARLEKIVQEMEDQELPLEQGLKKYEEGIKLSRFCLAKLSEAEKKIEILRRALEGNLVPEPFSPGSSEKDEDDATSRQD